MARSGEINYIKRVGGNEETKRHLETLGFVVGGAVTVISSLNGNLIVNVKDSRVAISREMANKIMVEGGDEIEDFTRYSGWHCSLREKTARGRCAETPNHGYGHHKRQRDLCPKSCSAG